MLASLLDITEEEVQAQPRQRSGADVVLSAAGHTFVVEVSPSATAGPVAARAGAAVEIAKKIRRRTTPLVVVPYMTESGRRACESAQVSWLDLSGNARIIAPGIRVIIEGRPNRFRRRGRPSSVFAPKSARVVRWLLMHADASFTQRQIARSADMSEGFVSRIAARLMEESYVIREESGALRVKDPDLLLDAWREEYQFSKHALLQGHVPARSGDALARFVSDTLAAARIEHAATGLAAAWLMTRFAAFRIATFFVSVEPSEELKEKLGFREEPRGANLWLVAPNDAGVFHGVKPRHGVPCVHPVQAYVDLKEHPERASEAAERVRAELLAWRRDG